MARTKQPEWELIDNLGDASPFDYGGYFVYRDKTGVYPEEAELLVEPEEEGGAYEVYRFALDRLKLVDGYLVPFEYDKSWPHPVERYDQWFHKEFEGIVSSIGAAKEDLEKAFMSADPRERAFAYRAVGDYHGWDNLDAYPISLTRKEVEERYPEIVGGRFRPSGKR